MPTITESFRIQGDEPVRVSLKIGNGMLGGFSALLGPDKLKPVQRTSSLAEYDLGKGSAARFKVLFASVLVIEVNPATNDMVVTAEIRQGNKVATFSVDEEAPPRGIVSYAIEIRFD
jgi:hypothetical protein